MDKTILEGVRVLDWTTMAAAPGASAILADHGAEVIKIETTYGDPWRKVLRYHHDPERTFGSVFEFDNRGKKSVSLNLNNNAGIKAFKALLGNADVLVCNVRVSGTQRLGLDYETLKYSFPKLIYAHLTAWGRQGPMVNAPGYDSGAFWAASGMLDTLRTQDEKRTLPALPGASGDHATSLALVSGIAMALFKRERTGKGMLVDVSLLRSGLWCNGMYLTAASASKDTLAAVKDPNRYGITFRGYETKDDEMIHLLGYQTRRHLPYFLKAIGLKEMRPGPPGNENGRPPLIDNILKSKTAAEWESIFDEHGVWYTRVLDFEHVANGLGGSKNANMGKMSRVAEQIDVTGGFLRRTGDVANEAGCLVASPIRIEYESMTQNVKIQPPRTPELGEHTTEVMLEAGFTLLQISELRAEGAFGKNESKL